MALLGMYRGWDGASNLDSYEAANPGLDIVYGHEFGDNSQWTWFTGGTNFANWNTWVGAQPGRRFTYSAPLLTQDEPGTQAQRYVKLANGDLDFHFTNLGNAFQAHPNLRNAVIRLGWEFNGTTFPWNVPPNDQTTLDNYKIGFARASAALKAACPTLEIEWCPNIQYDYTNRSFADLMPDPASWDYMGLGQYDYYWPGGSPSDQQRADWLILGDNGGGNGFADQVALADLHGKKKCFTEWGLWPSTNNSGGGDRPAYIELVANWMRDNGYSFHVYNNIDATVDHRLESFPNAQTEYVQQFSANRLLASFEDSQPIASNYHIFTDELDWDSPVGLMVYGDGSGEWGLNNPNETYLLDADGTAGLVAVAKSHNMILLTPMAPGDGCTDGDGVCWYMNSFDGTTLAQKIRWSKELVDYIYKQYEIDRNRIVLGGYSSGAQWATEYFGPAYASEIMDNGVVVGISFGGSPKVLGDTEYSRELIANVPYIWNTGADDPYAYQGGAGGVYGVQSGYNWYTDAGFTTDLTVIPGLAHARSDFSTVMDNAVSTWLDATTAPSQDSIGSPRLGALVGTSTSATLNVPYPDDVVQGDLLLIACVARAGSTTAAFTAAGWTGEFAHSREYARSGFLWKIADGTETGTVAVTGPSVEKTHKMMAVSGVDQANPIDSIPTKYDGSLNYVSSFTIPGQMPTRPGCMPVWVTTGWIGADTWSTPNTPAVEWLDTYQEAGSGRNGGAWYQDPLPDASVTGTRTGVADYDFDTSYSGVMILLRPASEGPVGDFTYLPANLVVELLNSTTKSLSWTNENATHYIIERNSFNGAGWLFDKFIESSALSLLDDIVADEKYRYRIKSISVLTGGSPGPEPEPDPEPEPETVLWSTDFSGGQTEYNNIIDTSWDEPPEWGDPAHNWHSSQLMRSFMRSGTRNGNKWSARFHNASGAGGNNLGIASSKQDVYYAYDCYIPSNWAGETHDMKIWGLAGLPDNEPGSYQATGGNQYSNAWSLRIHTRSSGQYSTSYPYFDAYLYAQEAGGRTLGSVGGYGIWFPFSYALNNDMDSGTTRVAVPIGTRFRLEMRVVMNTPDATDGECHVWLDGTKVVEITPSNGGGVRWVAGDGTFRAVSQLMNQTFYNESGGLSPSVGNHYIDYGSAVLSENFGAALPTEP